MAFVLLALALFCGIVAAKASERSTRLWFALWAAVNLGAAVHMVATDFPFWYKLLPSGSHYPWDYYRGRR